MKRCLIKKINVLFAALLLYCFQLSSFAQFTVSSSEFPMPGVKYARSYAVTNIDTIGNAGPNQSYSFTNLMMAGSDSVQYYDPAQTAFAANHPGANTTSIDVQGILTFWFYSSDGNAFWKSGITLIGDFGSGWDSASANYLPNVTDTLYSTDYTYGHAENEFSTVTLNLAAGFDYKITRKRSVQVDGWGTLKTPLNNWANIIRVKCIEYRYDTVLSFGIPVDNSGDTAYYYQYLAKDIRHPVVIAHTNAGDTIQYIEYLFIPPLIKGCTDPLAVNYNPLANQDDSSCVYCNTISYNITPDTFICKGDEMTLSVNGGVSQLWSTGDTISTINVSPDTTTTYSVYLMDTAGCWNMATVKVTVYNLAKASFWTFSQSYTQNDSIKFLNTSSGAGQFYWEFVDTPLNSSYNESPVHAYTTTGEKKVMLIAKNKCYADTFYRILTIIEALYVNDLLEGMDSQFFLYPNPASRYLFVKYHMPYPGKIDISIIDILGRKIEILKGNQNAGLHILQIKSQINALPSGIYYVQIKYSNASQNNVLNMSQKKWIKIQ